MVFGTPSNEYFFKQLPALIIVLSFNGKEYSPLNEVGDYFTVSGYWESAE